jgi:hypothetical protein
MKVASYLAQPGPYNSSPTTARILAIFHRRSVVRTCLSDIPHTSLLREASYHLWALGTARGQDDTTQSYGTGVSANVFADRYSHKPRGHLCTGSGGGDDYVISGLGLESEAHEQSRTNVTFEVFTAVTMMNVACCDVTPCGSCRNRRFGGTYRLLQSGWNRQAGNNVGSN